MEKEAEKSEKKIELVLPKIYADAMQERVERNEAEVVREINAIHQNFHCP